jgi:hypothetical protein
VFAIPEEIGPMGRNGKADTDTGRPDMEQWKILVLGVLRRRFNWPSEAHKTCMQCLCLVSGRGDGERAWTCRDAC